MKKHFWTLALFCTLAFTSFAQKVDYFHLSDVRLLGSPFKKAQQVDKQYILSLNADRLLAPYLYQAGFEPAADSYTNWENTGLDGHICGHYLSALSLMYASTGDQQIKDLLDYVVDQLAQCQAANGNGYLGGVPDGKRIWEEIHQGKIKSSGFSLNGKWVPLYNIHKVYNGLRDAYLYAGNQKAKRMLIDMTDWAVRLVENLSDAQVQDLLRSEHGGLNEVFADVYAITEKPEHLLLAQRFSHKVLLDPLLKGEDKLTGMHANTQIPKVIGFKRVAEVSHNPEWDKASQFFWETVTGNRTVAIGGNSVREHFHPSNNFSTMITSEEGPETCNTYNMMRLSKMLFADHPQECYISYYERAMYNHILSSQHPEKGGFVYFTPMRPGHYRVYSQPQTSFWCCVGSGLENHGKYGEMIYAHRKDQLFVNMYIPSLLEWQDHHTEVLMETAFPESSEVKLTINPEIKGEKFTLMLRCPSWIASAKGFKVKVNGKTFKHKTDPGTYLAIEREWKKGDQVIINLPMHLKMEQLPDKSNYYAFVYGPVVLGAVIDTTAMDGLFADDSRGGHIAHGKKLPLNDMPILVGQPEEILNQVKPVKGNPLTFSLGKAVFSSKYPNIKLEPFYKLHECRYAIYFQQTTPEGLKVLQEKIAREEANKMALDNRTIDLIYPGEQQPESDHFFQSEQSNTGISSDRRWRNSKEWFSYQLKPKGNEAAVLRLTYDTVERLFDFNIEVNGKLIQRVERKERPAVGNGYQEVDYALSSELLKQAPLTVRFVANPLSGTAKIYEIRLLKP